MRLIYIIAAIVTGEAVATGYRYGVGPLKRLYNIHMSKLEGNAIGINNKTVPMLENSPLKGKRVLFLGSSVTYGAASLGEGIPEFFAARFGCDITKEAVSGTTLTDDSNTSYVHRLMNNVDPDNKYDLAVIQLSTNDAGKNKPLGSITESVERSDFDTHTVTGAIESIIAYIREAWECSVIFYTNCRYDSKNYAAMVRRLYEIQEKWGIGILDLWSDEQFNEISDAERERYMNDKIHPTKAGYREWWCPEMEKQLLAILAG